MTIHLMGSPGGASLLSLSVGVMFDGELQQLTSFLDQQINLGM